jgi:membrane protein HdeD
MHTLELDDTVKRFGAHSLWVGILLLIVGTIGVILPVVLSELTIALVASLLLAGGLLWIWHSIRHGIGWTDWIKPVVLVAAGGLIAYKPWAGIAGVALLIAAYLVFDAIASFSLAGNASGKTGHGWMIFKGATDIVLAALFLWGWPQSSLWMVGLFVGISLIFDGWALVAIGWSLRHKQPAGDSS